MAKPLVLMLYNQPLLPKGHPDAESEHTVVEVAETMSAILAQEGFRVAPLPLGTNPAVLWTECRKRKPDVVFNLFEGNVGNPETESYVAGLLEWAGISYTGSPFPALSLARAKHTTKHLLKGAGLPTADFMAVHGLPMPKCSLAFPVIVKPATQDASVGMDQASVCVNPSALKRRVQYILATYGAPVIVEEYIPGRELNVSLVELPELTALPAAEIVLPREKAGQWSIYTYDGKWKADSSEYAQTSVRMATDLSAAMVRKLNRLAMSAYRLLGCRDYARVDFRLQADGKAYILEVNPNPDISEQADLTDFLVRLVNQALSRRHAPKPTFAPARR